MFNLHLYLPCVMFDDREDGTQFAPRPEDLVSKMEDDAEDDEEKTGEKAVYKAPRLRSAHFDDASGLWWRHLADIRDKTLPHICRNAEGNQGRRKAQEESSKVSTCQGCKHNSLQCSPTRFDVWLFQVQSEFTNRPEESAVIGGQLGEEASSSFPLRFMPHLSWSGVYWRLNTTLLVLFYFAEKNVKGRYKKLLEEQKERQQHEEDYFIRYLFWRQLILNSALLILQIGYIKEETEAAQACPYPCLWKPSWPCECTFPGDLLFRQTSLGLVHSMTTRTKSQKPPSSGSRMCQEMRTSRVKARRRGALDGPHLSQL